MSVNFIAYDPLLGAVSLMNVDTVGPGPENLTGGTGAGRMSFSFERIRGYDVNLGGGEFIYAQAAATISAGEVCQFTQTLTSGQLYNQAEAWAGTANSGDVLGVALVALNANQWGWFQIAGNAIVNVSASPTVGAPAYWEASGVISSTAVASKQILGAHFATASGVTLGSGNAAYTLSSTQAILTMNKPTAQGAIT